MLDVVEWVWIVCAWAGKLAICAAVGLAGAWCIVWALDEEELQVEAGVKHPMGCVLPVVKLNDVKGGEQ